MGWKRQPARLTEAGGLSCYLERDLVEERRAFSPRDRCELFARRRSSSPRLELSARDAELFARDWSLRPRRGAFARDAELFVRDAELLVRDPELRDPLDERLEPFDELRELLGELRAPAGARPRPAVAALGGRDLLLGHRLRELRDLLLEELRHALLLAANAAGELGRVLVVHGLREGLDARVGRDLLELVVVLGLRVLEHLLGLARAANRVQRTLRSGLGLAGHGRERGRCIDHRCRARADGPASALPPSSRMRVFS